MIQDKQGRSMKDMDIIKRLIKYAIPQKKKFALAVVLAILIVLIDVCLPLLMGYVIDLLSGRDIPISFLNQTGEFWPIVVLVILYLL